jgi:hypothetical protein
MIARKRREHVGRRPFTALVAIALLAGSGATSLVRSARSAETTSASITVRDPEGKPIAGAAVGVLEWLKEEC